MSNFKTLLVGSGWPKFSKTQFRGQAAFLLISVSELKIHIIPGPFEGKTSHPILLIGNTAGKSFSSLCCAMQCMST